MLRTILKYIFEIVFPKVQSIICDIFFFVIFDVFANTKRSLRKVKKLCKYISHSFVQHSQEPAQKISDVKTIKKLKTTKTRGKTMQKNLNCVYVIENTLNGILPTVLTKNIIIDYVFSLEFNKTVKTDCSNVVSVIAEHNSTHILSSRVPSGMPLVNYPVPLIKTYIHNGDDIFYNRVCLNYVLMNDAHLFRNRTKHNNEQKNNVTIYRGKMIGNINFPFDLHTEKIEYGDDICEWSSLIHGPLCSTTGPCMYADGYNISSVLTCKNYVFTMGIDKKNNTRMSVTRYEIIESFGTYLKDQKHTICRNQKRLYIKNRSTYFMVEHKNMLFIVTNLETIVYDPENMEKIKLFDEINNTSADRLHHSLKGLIQGACSNDEYIFLFRKLKEAIFVDTYIVFNGIFPSSVSIRLVRSIILNNIEHVKLVSACNENISIIDESNNLILLRFNKTQ
jgi:hypothetical protein